MSGAQSALFNFEMSGAHVLVIKSSKIELFSIIKCRNQFPNQNLRFIALCSKSKVHSVILGMSKVDDTGS